MLMEIEAVRRTHTFGISPFVCVLGLSILFAFGSLRGLPEINRRSLRRPLSSSLHRASSWYLSTPRSSPQLSAPCQSTPLSADPLPPYVLEWLHIPKTGTSFGNTLILWACPELDPTRTWQEAGRSHIPASCAARFRKIESKVVAIGDHEKLTNRTEAELSRVFTMVRDPKRHLVSVYHHVHRTRRLEPYHKDATEPEICAWFEREYPLATRGMQLFFVTAPNWPWQRMREPPEVLANITLREPTQAMVIEGCRRLRIFAFVGITEYWAASVCLFHAQHGGPTHAVELKNVQPGGYQTAQGALQEVGCAHWSDKQLYGCALELFKQRLGEHPQCREHMPPDWRLGSKA